MIKYVIRGTLCLPFWGAYTNHTENTYFLVPRPPGTCLHFLPSHSNCDLDRALSLLKADFIPTCTPLKPSADDPNLWEFTDSWGACMGPN